MIGPDSESISGTRMRVPGVYIEHRVESGDRGFETGVPLFVGFASLVTPGSKDRVSASGTPIGKRAERSRLALLRIDSVEELSTAVAGAVDGGYLLSAVRGFFDNGGKRCVVAAIDRLCDRPEIELRQLFQAGGVLELVDDVDLVCVPDALIDSIAVLPDQVLAIQHDVLAYCERMGERFAILDGPRRLLETLSMEHPDSGSSESGLPVSVNGAGAIYVPWIGLCANGSGGSVRMVPPSGHVAGVYARSDRHVGPHQPPANALVEGVVDLTIEISDATQSGLNDLGVNCLRSLPGRGIRVWGARTLSSRPGWRYVNVRRVFLTLTRWLEITMADLVLEPNTESLWAQIRQRVQSYCTELMKQGALAGHNPSEAYVVKCDAETNPPELRDQGMLVSVIGLATVVPAEFLYVRVTQSANGTVVTPILR